MEAYKSLPRSCRGHGVWRIYSTLEHKNEYRKVERVKRGPGWRPINPCRGLAEDMEFGESTVQ
jgi:hypothetical protein